MAKVNPITLKESEKVEFKESFNDSALKTLAAFANTKGGSLYVGVKDDVTIVSKGIADEVQQDVVNKTIQVLGITPEVSLHQYKGRDFLEVKVKQQRPPVSVRGKYYHRVGNTTREITGDDLKQLFLEGESWDAITNDRFSFEDIDFDQVQDFAKSAQNEDRISPDIDIDDPKVILDRLGLLVDGQLTNGAILLFGHDPQKYFPNAVVRIGRFRDEATIVADRTVSGNLFKQVQESEEQIKSLISRRYEISDDSFKRRDIWQYPLSAIREALLNSLVHRSYFEMNVKIQIKVFDDMLWIYNPGKLPGSLQVKDLKKPHSSHPRNRLIANTFYRAGLIEEWGSGIERMTATLKENGLPEPGFEEQGQGFVAKLYGRDSSEINSADLESLNSRQKTAIEYAKEHGSIDNSTYQELTDISRQTATRDLSDLTDKGIFKQKGQGAGTHYILIEQRYF